MNHTAHGFNIPVAKPAAKVLRRPFTEAEYAKAWKKMALAEGHARKMPMPVQYIIGAERTAVMERVMAIIGEEPVLRSDVAMKMGISKDTASYCLNRLVREGRVDVELVRLPGNNALAKSYSKLRAASDGCGQ